jgi:DNA-binding response OmpR family regulator
MQAVALRPRPADLGAERIGPIEFVESQPYVLVDGLVVDLTRREMEVLSLLRQRAGEVVPRDELYQRIWGMKLQHTDRSLDVYVRRLRRKLGSAAPEWSFIDTRHRIGYRLAPKRAKESRRQGRHS